MRYHFLDNLRGLTFISMAAFHTMWDLTNMFGVAAPWFNGAAGHVWQQSILWTFVLLSGFCWGLGHHQLKRGLIVFGAGAAVTLVTMIAMPTDAVYFGVLSFLGAAMIVLVPFKKLLEKTPALPALIVCIFLFLILRDVPFGYLGFEGFHLVQIPDVFYANWATTAIGFQMPGFVSSDYVPFIPWILLYLCGYFVFRLIPRDENGNMKLPAQSQWGIANVIGRHSLGFYLVHQVAIYAVLTVIFIFI